MDLQVFLKTNSFYMVLIPHVVQQEFFLVMHSETMAIDLEIFFLLFKVIVNRASNLFSGDERYQILSLRFSDVFTIQLLD